MAGDPLRHREQWRVRAYELDSNGHVNNAVYLNWAEEIAILHAEASGYGRAWTVAHGGAWFVHRAEIRFLRPAGYGELIDVETRVESMSGARAVRRTDMRRAADGEVLAEIVAEWVWVRASDGRPMRIPAELVRMVRGTPG